jgi:hypothetical protein
MNGLVASVLPFDQVATVHISGGGGTGMKKGSGQF